jgi:hypothetical protein
MQSPVNKHLGNGYRPPTCSPKVHTFVLLELQVASQTWGCTPIIPTTQEEETGESWFKNSLGKKR